mgnify:CR=1 FL=1
MSDKKRSKGNKKDQKGDYAKRYKRGMDLLKKMGREELMLDQKALSPELYEISVGHLFGDVWARPGLSLRERQLVTLAANMTVDFALRPSGPPPQPSGGVDVRLARLRQRGDDLAGVDLGQLVGVAAGRRDQARQPAEQLVGDAGGQTHAMRSFSAPGALCATRFS